MIGLAVLSYSMDEIRKMYGGVFLYSNPLGSYEQSKFSRLVAKLKILLTCDWCLQIDVTVTHVFFPIDQMLFQELFQIFARAGRLSFSILVSGLISESGVSFQTHPINIKGVTGCSNSSSPPTCINGRLFANCSTSTMSVLNSFSQTSDWPSAFFNGVFTARTNLS